MESMTPLSELNCSMAKATAWLRVRARLVEVEPATNNARPTSADANESFCEWGARNGNARTHRSTRSRSWLPGL